MRRLTRCALTVLIALNSVARTTAQNLTGTVTAADTGTGIAGSTVVAIRRPSTASQMPTIYKARVDASGRFALVVGTGTYQLCVYDAGLYLDPCQWESATTQLLNTGPPTSIALRLQKGVPFVVRAHDTKQLVRGAENVRGVRGQSMRVFPSTPGLRLFPLPVLYDNGRIRDYGTVVPANRALSVTISSTSLVIADRAGVALAERGIPFQVSSDEAAEFKPQRGAAKWGLPGQSATLLHIYATARK